MNISSLSRTLGLTALLLLGAVGAGRAQVVPASLSPADHATRARAADTAKSFGKLPLYFIENRGQLDSRVAYYVQGSDKAIYFTDQGLTFALQGGAQARTSGRWALKLDFVGARAGVRPQGQEPAGATFSYFKGRRSQWRAGLKTYSEIVYRDLWPGIDLVYAGTVNRMKYTFRVKPGADPGQIKLAWRGAGVALNPAGELAVTTPAGGFTDERPVSWQQADGRQVEVATKYRLAANGKVLKASTAGAAGAAVAYGFEVGGYDRSRELVIDPAVLVYAGFLGGSGSDEGRGIAVDGAGNAYVTGVTDSTGTFPVTVGPDLTHNGSADAFVAKVNAAGTALVYAGFIGGSADDGGNGIAVDGAGNAYITGFADSDETSFPVAVGPDLTSNGNQDAFVAKVNAAGTALDYCGYIGGANNEQGAGIAVDGVGNAYVTGSTKSNETTFPVTVGPDLTFNSFLSSIDDAFVAKVNASGTALLYAGYIGGGFNDIGNGIAVDSAGNAYVAGTTASDEASFPVMVGPGLTSSGDDDAFVAKVNASGTALLYAGYIGGDGTDSGSDIALDSAGNAYVTGSAFSDETSFPVTVGPDLTHNGAIDTFVAKVNASGTALGYCGFIGGASATFGNSIAVDGAGNAYVTGAIDSDETTFPVTVGPDLTFNGGLDSFVAKVDASGTSLLYAGYIGGAGIDFGNGIAVDSAGNAYVTGVTDSDETSFPATAGPDLTFNGGQDAFVAKISAPTPQDLIADLIAQINALVAGGQLAANKANPLLTKLESVVNKLDAAQAGAACNQIGAFISQINAYINSGTLTPAQGQALIQSAQAIQTTLGC